MTKPIAWRINMGLVSKVVFYTSIYILACPAGALARQPEKTKRS